MSNNHFDTLEYYINWTWQRSTPEDIEVVKGLVDRTPDHWLQDHLNNAIKREDYELATYIRDVAKSKNVILIHPQ